MVATQVWLEVKNGRTTVLDAETARRQHKRRNKKRKPNPPTKNGPNGAKTRQHDITDTEQQTNDTQLLDEDDGFAHDANVQLFADAQLQLQQEMAAAGFGDDALPLSFGSAHASSTASSSRKRKRRPHDNTRDTVKPVQPVTVPTVMEKVHVTFDSDGEIAERVVEAVVLPDATTPDETKPHELLDAQVQEDQVVEAAETIRETTEAEAEPAQVDPAVFKFWKQRRTLFHKYDDGIQLDHESWYSVTPESIAAHIARRCACAVIVDPFSGCGGNIIQFAQTCSHVIAIEIDADKIRMAKANAAIYGVADRIEWIHGDALQVLPTLQADVVFLSPPWGGLSYSRTRFGIEEMKIGTASGVELFEMARRVAKNVVYYLPKTTPEAELQALVPEEAVECEHIHLNGQLKVVNAYYGDLAFSNHQDDEPKDAHGEDAVQVEDIETENADNSEDNVRHVTE